MLLSKRKTFGRIIRAMLVLVGLAYVGFFTHVIFNDGAAHDRNSPLTGNGRAAPLQDRIKSATSKVFPFVVAVGPWGTGVIVSADGLVLSQAHVTPGPEIVHAAARSQKSNERGETIKVFLHDGTEVIADVIGWDALYDLSVLKLKKPGPYPHAVLSETMAEPGSWVLKFGYPLPLGFRRGRSPEVRLGKVLHCSETTFVTDCLSNGGDSGGPYFDLDGSLVGIINTIHPLDPLLLNTGGFATPAKLIRTRFETMARGELLYPTAAEVRKVEAGRTLRAADMLPDDQWFQGSKTRAIFREVVAAANLSTVEVLDGEVRAALGTVVDDDGLVLTKASEVPDGPHCRLADGRVLAAQVVGFDPAYDLALLRVPACGLKPATWAASSNTPVGGLVVATGTGRSPVKIGIVSLPIQAFSGPFANDVPRPQAKRVLPPAVLGSAVPGRGYWVEFVDGNAASAGICQGHLLVSIAGVPIRSHADLLNCVDGRRGGDQVPVQLVRAGKMLSLTLNLKTDPKTIERNHISNHRVMPPVGIPVAVSVDADECGGPLVGLDGKVIGLIIGRPAVTFALVLPGDRIAERLKDLKQGLPRAALRQRAILMPPTPKPVTAGRSEIVGKLKERAERYASVLVEYGVTTEADVDPRLLVAWQLDTGRDFRERHRIAFLGTKRLIEFTPSRAFALPAPAFEPTPDPAAPADVARSLEIARRVDTASSMAGLIDHFFRRSSGEVERWIFDDKNLPDAARYEPTDYLANIGLQPLAPKPEDQAAEQAWRLPGNFARLPQCRVRPNEEIVDGAGCVALEVPLEHGTETVWLDPRLGYSPRKWEVRINDRLVCRRTNTDFREFAPGCWLPLEAAQACGPPAWVSVGTRGESAYTKRMVLRYARVNDIPDTVFTK